MANGTLGLDQAAFYDRMSIAPAELVGLADHGNPIAIDNVANLVVFDQSATWVPTTSMSKSRNAPYLGRELTGRPVATIYRGTVTAGVQGLVDNPTAGFYLVAEWEGTLAGALMVTFEWSDWRNGHFWWIQSVYVPPEFLRHGVFTRLYEAVRTMGQSRADVCGLRLYVEQDNAVAQKTYESLGMDETHYDMYEAEFGR